MTGFKQHGQHLAPQVGGLHGFAGLDQTLACLRFVSDIGFFKLGAEFVMQIRRVGGREQSPLALFHDATHE